MTLRARKEYLNALRSRYQNATKSQYKYYDKDYSRQGGQVSARYSGSELNLLAKFVSFEDVYSEKIIKQVDCGVGSYDGLSIANCSRRDEGQAYQISVGYSATEDYGLLFLVDHREIKNHSFPEFNKSQTNVLFELHTTLAPKLAAIQGMLRFGSILLNPLTDTAL